MDFLAFMEERGKENNTYFIDVFIIQNVEVRLIENGWKKYRDIVRLHMRLWKKDRKVQTVSVFIINGFVYCSIFVY